MNIHKHIYIYIYINRTSNVQRGAVGERRDRGRRSLPGRGGDIYIYIYMCICMCICI